jgi:hypothetical protein
MNDKEIDEIEIEFLAILKDSLEKESNGVKKGYYISLETSLKWLNVEDIYQKYIENDNSRKHFKIKIRGVTNNNYRLDETKDENNLECDFIMRKNANNISLPWFSTEGFKTLCLILNVEKSYYVRKYFIRIEKKYWRALHQTNEENAKELESLNKKIKESNSSLIDMAERFKNSSELNKILDVRVFESNVKLQHVYRYNSEIFSDPIDHTSNIEILYYKKIENLLCTRKVKLYLVNPQYIYNIYYKSAKDTLVPKRSRKKKTLKVSKNEENKKINDLEIMYKALDMNSESNDESNSDLESELKNAEDHDKNNLVETDSSIIEERISYIINQEYEWTDYENNYNNYCINEISDDNENLYYFAFSGLISKKDTVKDENIYKHLIDLKFYNKAQYDKFFELINKNIEKNSIKNIYKTIYSNIIDAQYKSFIDIYNKKN